MTQLTKEDEWHRLANQIKDWNENRLDLFELSLPNEVNKTDFDKLSLS